MLEHIAHFSYLRCDEIYKDDKTFRHIKILQNLQYNYMNIKEKDAKRHANWIYKIITVL